MNKYRKKPVVVEAMKITNYSAGDIQSLGDGVSIDADENGSLVVFIETLEGTMKGNVGDYIIRGVSGELYPCKSDIFNATYESVGIDE